MQLISVHKTSDVKQVLIILIITVLSGILLFLERFFASGWFWEIRLYYVYVISFVLYAGSFFLMTRLFSSVRPMIILLILLIPQTGVLLYVLVEPGLHFRIPTLYPVSTIMVFTGMLFVTWVIQRKYQVAIIFFFLIGAFLFIYHRYIVVPWLIKDGLTEKNITYRKVNLYLLSGADSNQVHWLSSKIVVMEFWFKDCLPCKKKIIVLKELQERFKRDTNVVFITINDGSIDSYKTFEEEIRKPVYNGFYNLYDSAGLFTKQQQIDGFPVELILKGDSLVRVYSGWFYGDAKEKYLGQSAVLINQLKNE